MKSLFCPTLACLLLLFSCKKDRPVEDTSFNTEIISGIISQSITLKANVTYQLKGQVFVKNNAVLTIPSGVTIQVEKAENPADKSALIITKGSKLIINGTAEMPVVFTSAAASKSPGDWIGIIILGKAPTNLNAAHIKGLPSSSDTEFGSTIADDNSGSINYLRLEYAGGLNPAQEDEWEIDMASGLSLMGVGSGTQLDHIMVSNSRDDGFQFVGGTANAKYLISFNNGDDDFDFDRGYAGKLQFLVACKKELSNLVIRGNGIESLNDNIASDAQPFTRPVISNITILGPEVVSTDIVNQSQGIYIRKNTRFLVRNSIIAGYSNGGLMLCPRTKVLLLNTTESQFKYNIVNADVPGRTFTYDTGGAGLNIVPDPEVAGYAVETSDIQKIAINFNQIVESISQLQLQSVSSSALNVTLKSESPAMSGANFTDPEYSSFFTNVAFRGAIGTQNWTLGNWTNWK